VIEPKLGVPNPELFCVSVDGVNEETSVVLDEEVPARVSDDCVDTVDTGGSPLSDESAAATSRSPNRTKASFCKRIQVASLMWGVPWTVGVDPFKSEEEG
jgi:hypothetical protein